MRTTILAAVLIAPMLAAPAFADPMADLAKSKQCFTCHDVTKELTAPSFKAIATKYKGMKNAEVKLADTIEKGGVGHFGTATMPSEAARVKLSGEEARSLAVWVLNTK